MKSNKENWWSVVNEEADEFFAEADEFERNTIFDSRTLAEDMHASAKSFTKAKSFPIVGKTFVFTGVLENWSRKEISKLLEESFGAYVLNAVPKTGHLDYLVVGKNPGSKYQDAQKKKGVLIINEWELKQLMGQSSEPVVPPITKAPETQPNEESTEPKTNKGLGNILFETFTTVTMKGSLPVVTCYLYSSARRTKMDEVYKKLNKALKSNEKTKNYSIDRIEFIDTPVEANDPDDLYFLAYLQSSK